MSLTNTADHILTMELGNDYPEIRDAISKICINFPGAYWRELDKESAYPTEFVQTLTDAGYLSALIPETYGGAGLPLRAASVILETIHACGGNAGACHAQMYMMGTLLRHGSTKQKQANLPMIANGDLRLQAFAVTEPDSGSDTPSLKTRAIKEADEYVINGQKIWTSRALHSDLMILLARTTAIDETAKRTAGLSIFLIDIRDAKAAEGLTIQPIDALINHNTTEIFFENFRIPASSLIGKEGNGFRYVLDGMNAERILLASEAIGDAKYFIRRATEYAKERTVFGRQIGQNQAIQFPLAQAYAEVQAADLMVRKAAAMFDRAKFEDAQSDAGRTCGSEANMAKLLASDACWKAAETCMQTFGGFAFAREYDIERKWRECRLFRTAPISNNLVLAYLGQHVLDLPRSY
jgi:acyl-CoA dehydrogenase